MTGSASTAGTVSALYIRRARSSAPERVLSSCALQGLGLMHDRHSTHHSLRQVLVVSELAYATHGLREGALRENVLTGMSTLDMRSGDALYIGPAVVLRITFHCEPCNRLTRLCGEGAANALGGLRGVLARVVQGGTMRAGDRILIERARYPALSEDWRERVLEVARSVPPAMQLSYGRLAAMAGINPAYCRALPRLLSAHSELAPRIRASTDLVKEEWSGPSFPDELTTSKKGER